MNNVVVTRWGEKPAAAEPLSLVSVLGDGAATGEGVYVQPVSHITTATSTASIMQIEANGIWSILVAMSSEFRQWLSLVTQSGSLNSKCHVLCPKLLYCSNLLIKQGIIRIIDLVNQPPNQLVRFNIFFLLVSPRSF